MDIWQEQQKRIADLETKLNEAVKAQNELHERLYLMDALNNDLQLLCHAAFPFVALVKDTDGRIPTERLSFANWHDLTKAFNRITARKIDAFWDADGLGASMSDMSVI